jgi:hypothetical protein
MPKVDLKPLEEIFHARVFKMLKEKWKVNDDLINKRPLQKSLPYHMAF